MEIQQDFEYRKKLEFYYFLQINLFGRRFDGDEQRCDKSNRYAMPLEKSIEVCISLIIGLDSLF